MSRLTATGTKGDESFSIAYGKDHACGWFLQIVLIPDYKVGDTLEVLVEGESDWTKEIVEIMKVGDIDPTLLTVKIQGLPDATEFIHYLEFEDLAVFDRDSVFNGLTYVEMVRELASYGVNCQL